MRKKIILILIAALSSCASPPDSPKSVYFQRLLTVSAENSSPHEISSPRDEEAESHVIRNLIEDGFVVEGGLGQMADALGSITCEGYRMVRVESEGRELYQIRMLWGGVFTHPPLTAFSIDVYRAEDCAVVQVIGKRRRQAL